MERVSFVKTATTGSFVTRNVRQLVSEDVTGSMEDVNPVKLVSLVVFVTLLVDNTVEA